MKRSRRTQKVASILIAAFTFSIIFANYLHIANGATYLFTQNSWSGGASAGTVSAPTLSTTTYQGSTNVVAPAVTIGLATTTASLSARTDITQNWLKTIESGPGYSAMAVSTSGIVHVVYASKEYNANYWNLVYRNSTNWNNPIYISTDTANNYFQYTTNPSLAIDSSGNLHLAYVSGEAGGGGDVEYRYALASSNWQSWSSPVAVATTGKSAAQPSIAVSATNTVYVAYRSNEYNAFFNIAIRNASSSSNWQSWSARTDLTTSTQGAASPWIAIGSDGTVHVTYSSNEQSASFSNIEYRNSLSNWSRVDITTSASGNNVNPQILLNASNTANITYNGNSNTGVYLSSSSGTNYASWSSPSKISLYPLNNSQWSLSINASGTLQLVYSYIGVATIYYENATNWISSQSVVSTNGYAPLLGADASGNMYMVYQSEEYNASNYNMAYRSLPNGGSWSGRTDLTTNYGDRSIQNVVSAIDASNTVHDVYLSKEYTAGGGLNLAYRNSTNWNNRIDITTSSPTIYNTFESLAVAAGAPGKLVMTYLSEEYNASNYNLAVRYSSNGGATWSPRIDLSTSTSGNQYINSPAQGPSLIYGQNSGNFYIAVSNNSTGLDIFKSSNNGQTWTKVASGVGSSIFTYAPGIFEDSSGTLHLTYMSKEYTTSGTNAAYRYSTNQGVSWSSRLDVTTSSNGYSQGSAPNYIGAVSGNIFIVYDTGSGMVLTHSLNSGASWSGVDQSLCSGGSGAVNVSNSGIVNVTYLCGLNGPYYTFWNGSSWSSPLTIGSGAGTNYYGTTPPLVTSTGTILFDYPSKEFNASVINIAQETYSPSVYYSSGNVVSDPYNTGDPTNVISMLTWTEATTTGNGTSLSISAATSSGNLGASWTMFTETSTGCSASASVVTCPLAALTAANASLTTSGNNKYWQYKVGESSNGGNSPSVSSVGVQYVINAPPQFNSSVGGGTGVSVSELATSPVPPGQAQFQFAVLDPDATNGETLTPTFQYSLNGGTSWSSMQTFITPNATATIPVSTSTYATTTIVWNAAADLGSQYTTNAMVRVTVNDGQPANNLATATSSAFALDTNPPVINSFTMDASKGTVNYNLSDNSNISYRLSPTSFATSTPTSTLPFIAVGGNATSVANYSFNFTATSSPLAYLEVEDVYGNDTYQAYTGPAKPTGLAVKDISNSQTGVYGVYLSWGTDAIANFKQYDIFRSTGGVFTQIGTTLSVASTSYTDYGLSSTTVYYYKVRAEDTNGNISAYTPQMFITPTGNGGGPAISSVSANPSDTNAIVTWNTNILPQSSYVYYSTSPSMAAPVSIVAAVATSGPPFVNTANLTNLTPSLTYYFYVQSTDLQGDTTIDNNGGNYYSFMATNSQPPVIGNVQLTPTQNSVDIRWTTNKPSNSAVFYGTAAGHETASASSSVGHTTTPEVLLTGLTPSTTYYYYLYSSDSLGHVATTSEAYFVTSQFAPIISGVTNSAVTTSTATITRTTDKISNSFIFYSATTTPSSFVGVAGNTLTTAHTVTLIGLMPTTTYYYYVQSTDPSGDIGTDNNNGQYYTVKTAPDTTPPVISNIATPSLGQTVATITWTTNKSASSQVFYGTSTVAYASSSPSDGTLLTAHSVSLSNLAAATTYYFVVSSTDQYGNKATSSQQTFATLTQPGPQITGVTVATTSDFGATITWTTNTDSDSHVYYSTSTTNFSQSAGSTAFVGGTAPYSHSVSLVGLAPGTRYYFYVQSTDINNNTTIDKNGSTYYSVTTTNTAQPTISSVAATSLTTSSTIITWSTDKLSNSQVLYGTTSGSYPSSTAVQDISPRVSAHSVPISGLAANTLYYYVVKSADSAGNVSRSAEQSFATLTPTGPQISSTTVASTTDFSATITWLTNTNSDSHVYYSNSTASFPFSSGSSNLVGGSAPYLHSVTVTGLTPSSTYYFYVQSVDAYNNSSIDKNGGAYYSFITTDRQSPVLSGVSVVVKSQTTAGITWSTDKLSNSQVLYGTTSGSYPSSTAITDGSYVTSPHSSALNGLSPQTTYYFIAQSADAAGNVGTSTESNFTTLAPIAPQISAIASTTSDFGATVTWLTNSSADSKVYYGATTSTLTLLAADSSLDTSHSVSITGLAQHTKYYFYVQSTDAGNNTTIDNNNGQYYAFTTTATQPPVIANVAVGTVSISSANVTWTTNVPTDESFYLATSTSAVMAADPLVDTKFATSHSEESDNLVGGTTYYFAITATDAFGNVATDTNGGAYYSFTTLPAVATISNTAVTSTPTSFTATWTTSIPATSYVYYSTSTSTINSATAIGSDVPTGTHSVTVPNLSASTTYYFYVKSTDANGNVATDTNGGAYYQVATLPGIAISNVASSPADTTALITWYTQTSADSFVFYGTASSSLDTSVGSSTLVTGAAPFAHSVLVTGLAPSTTYYFYVQSTDGQGNIMTDNNNGNDYSFTTTFSEPPTLSGITVSYLTGDTAGISWTTDKLTDSEVYYGLASGQEASSTASSSLVTAHQIFVDGLTPQTTYYYVVRSADSAGNAASSSELTFTTQTPVFSNVTTTYVGDTSAIVSWNTTMDSNSFVHYFDPTSGSSNAVGVGTSTFVGGSAPFQHSVEVDSLNPGITYEYYLESDDANGAAHIDDNYKNYYQFTTTDHRPPVITNIQAPVVNASSAIITWSTDRLSTSQVNWGSNAGVYPSSTAIDPTLTIYHAVSVDGLTASTTYHFQVLSKTNVGVQSASGDNTFSTEPEGQTIVLGGGGGQMYQAPDTTPPKITAVVATTTPFDAIVQFATDKPAIGFVDYGSSTDYSYAAADGMFNATHTIIAKGLVMGTTYHFYVKAIDKSGNVATTTDQTFTTQYLTEASLSPTTTFENAYQFQQEIENSIASALPSLVPPFLGAPVISSTTENSAIVSWTTNINSYSIAYYTPDSNYDPTAKNPYGLQTSDISTKVMNHALTLTGLVPNTLYHVMAESFSIPGVFGKSSDVTFTTAASKVTAQVSSITPNGFRVSWTTDAPTNSVVQYKDMKTGRTQTITDDTMTTLHAVDVQNLSSANAYQVTASGYTAAGNIIPAANTINVKTTKDVTPPKVANIKIQTIIDPQTPNVAEALVGWTTDKPANSTVRYDAGVGSATSTFSHTIQDLTSFTNDHVVVVPNLVPGSIYRIQVASMDEASNTTIFPTQTIVVSQQSQSILDVILNNFENTFQFLHNVQP